MLSSLRKYIFCTFMYFVKLLYMKAHVHLVPTFPHYIIAEKGHFSLYSILHKLSTRDGYMFSHI